MAGRRRGQAGGSQFASSVERTGPPHFAALRSCCVFCRLGVFGHTALLKSVCAAFSLAFAHFAQKQAPLLLLSKAPWKTGTRPPTPAPADLLRALGHSPGLSTSLFSYLKWEQGPLPPQLQRGSLWKSKGQSSHGLLFSLSRSHFYLPRPSPAMLPTATTQQRGRSPRTLTLEPDVEG